MSNENIASVSDRDDMKRANEWLDELTPFWIDDKGNSKWAIDGKEYEAHEAIDYWMDNCR